MRLIKTTAVSPLPETSSMGQEASLKRAIRAAKRGNSVEHPNVALTFIDLGDFYARSENFEQSEGAYRAAVEIYENLGVGHELLLAMALRSLSNVLFAQRKSSESAACDHRAQRLILNFQ